MDKSIRIGLFCNCIILLGVVGNSDERVMQTSIIRLIQMISFTCIYTHVYQN